MSDKKMPRLPKPGKQRVWMHKETARLVEVFNGFLGPGLFFAETDLYRTWCKETPGYFADDERWTPEDYVDLGEL